MNRSTALAQAARRVRSINERIPEAHRLDVAPDWSALLDHIEGQTERRAVKFIESWQEEMETRLCRRLLSAPLEVNR